MYRQGRGGWTYVMRTLPLALCLAMLWSVTVYGQGRSSDVATVTITPAQIIWQVHGGYGTVILTVSIPDGDVLRYEFERGEAIVYPFDAQSAELPNGSYTYELRVIPAFDQGIRTALANARKQGNDETVVKNYRRQGVLPTEPITQTGAFTVDKGTIVVPDTITEVE